MYVLKMFFWCVSWRGYGKRKHDVLSFEGGQRFEYAMRPTRKKRFPPRGTHSSETAPRYGLHRLMYLHNK